MPLQTVGVQCHSASFTSSVTLLMYCSMSGVKPTEEEEDPFYTMLDRSGCAKFHYKLQDCFHDNGGDWRKCQLEMREFRECMNKQKQTSR